MLEWLADGFMVCVACVTAFGLVVMLGLAWAWVKVAWQRRRKC